MLFLNVYSQCGINDQKCLFPSVIIVVQKKEMLHLIFQKT